MATFLVYDIKWDLEQDGVRLASPALETSLPRYAVVWLPEWEACECPEDDVEAVLDKLSNDHGFCVKDYGKMITIEAIDAEDTSDHPCMARPT